jgi:hypothetical protein
MKIQKNSKNLKKYPKKNFQSDPLSPGHVTAYVRVPLRLVGLVIGNNGVCFLFHLSHQLIILSMI